MSNFVAGAIEDAKGRAFLARCARLLDVALQPIFELQTGALYGAEALTRGWADLGHDSAHALFDEANQLGVLARLEAQQMETAVEKVGLLKGPLAPHLFVNIDTRLLFSSTAVIDRLEAALRKAGRSRRLVTVELSERHDKSLEPVIADRIRQIRQRGFLLALDDFGVGVSDMRSLHDFDIDVIKIDRFFVDGVASDRRKRFLVGRMVELAHLLGQKALCEGVERSADLRVCQELGADLAQGYLLGAPETDMERVRTEPISLQELADGQASGGANARLVTELELIEPVHIADHISHVVARFRPPSHPPYCPIVGDQGEPVGVIREADLRPYVYAPHGLDLLKNKTEPVKIADLLRRYPVAKVDTDLSCLSDMLTDANCDGVLITEGVRYKGFLPAAALVRMEHARTLAAAQDANPLTGLPGNRVISGFLEDARASDSDRAICYFDFDNFKPFNDVYGFPIGDRAITMFSEILKKTFTEPGMVICHIGGDDFFVGAVAEPGSGLREKFVNAVLETRLRFSLSAESFYTPQDRAAGGFHALDRQGERRFFPLLSCSAGVICAEPSAKSTLDRVAWEIAEVKGLAKASPTGMAVTDLSEKGRSTAEIAQSPIGPVETFRTVQLSS